MLPSLFFSTVLFLSPNNHQTAPTDSVIVEYVVENPQVNVVDAEGRKQGVWMSYHANSMLQSVTYFVNDQLEGPLVQLSDRGYLLSEEHFLNNEYHGTQRYFNLGVLSKLVMYKNGVYDGVFETYHRNRNIAERHFYENGKKHGLSVWYFENGEPSFVYAYHYGAIAGTVTVYHKNGMVKSATAYTNNQMHGDFLELHENGTTAVKGQYKNGEKVGEWLFYSDRGDLIRKEKAQKKK